MGKRNEAKDMPENGKQEERPLKKHRDCVQSCNNEPSTPPRRSARIICMQAKAPPLPDCPKKSDKAEKRHRAADSPTVASELPTKKSKRDEKHARLAADSATIDSETIPPSQQSMEITATTLQNGRQEGSEPSGKRQKRHKVQEGQEVPPPPLPKDTPQNSSAVSLPSSLDAGHTGDHLESRIQHLGQDAAMLFKIFKALGVLALQPRNRPFSRLQPALETLCNRKVQGNHLFQVAALWPGLLQLSRVTVEGTADIYVRPLQLFNKREQHIAFLEKLEKADWRRVQKQVTKDLRKLGPSCHTMPHRLLSAPVLREAEMHHAERTREVTDTEEVRELLQNPIRKELAFLSHAKQVKVKQAAKADKAMANADLQSRVHTQRLVCYLPRLVDMIQTDFRLCKISSMGWTQLVSHLHATHPQKHQLQPSDIDEQLELLTRVVPEWCSKRPLNALPVPHEGSSKMAPEFAFCVSDLARSLVMSAIKDFEAKI